MKDVNGIEIKVGDLVECVETGVIGISKGKKYKVLEYFPDSQRVKINPDDRGVEGHYLPKRFKIVSSLE